METNRMGRFARNAFDDGYLGTPDGRGPRMVANATILGVSTLADIVESKLFRTVRTFVFEGKSKRLEGELAHAVAVRNAHTAEPAPLSVQERNMQRLADELQIQIIRDSLRKHKAVESGVEFVEEAVSDELVIRDGGNKLLNTWAGTTGEKYVKGTAETISGYANALIQVFYNDRWFGFMDKDGNPRRFMGIMLAEKSMNFVNPFNVEAAFRLLADVPGVGRSVLPVKRLGDYFLDASPVAKWANTIFSKFLLGYHVKNSMEKAVQRTEAAAGVA